MTSKAITTLFTVSFACFAIGTDIVGAGVIMVAIEHEFLTSIAATQWVVSIFALTFAMGIVAGGRLADMFGRRRVFLIGLTIFAIAALGCAWAPNLLWLIAARAVQGTGAAIIWPCIIGLCVAATSKEKRGLAVGMVLAMCGLGNIIGPMIAGTLSDLASWRWFFIVNVALAAFSALLTWGFIAPDRSSQPRESVDFMGIAVLSGAIFALLYACTQTDVWGWTSPIIIGLFIVSALLFIAFPLLQKRVTEPLVPPQLMRQHHLMIAIAENALLTPVVFIAFIYIPQYAHKALGWHLLPAAFTSIPLMITWAIFNPICGRLYSILGPKCLVGIGYCILTIGSMLLAISPPSAGYMPIAIGLALIGLGAACCVGPSSTTAIDLASEPQASLVGGLAFMAHLLMAAVGVAVATTIIVATTKSWFATHVAHLDLSPALLSDLSKTLTNKPLTEQVLSGIHADQLETLQALTTHAFAHGFHMALWFGIIIAIIGAIMALWLPGKQTIADKHRCLP